MRVTIRLEGRDMDYELIHTSSDYTLAGDDKVTLSRLLVEVTKKAHNLLDSAERGE